MSLKIRRRPRSGASTCARPSRSRSSPRRRASADARGPLGARAVVGARRSARARADQRPQRDAWPRRAVRDLFARPDRRCLVLADGWYEWLRPERPKRPRVPFRYTVDGGEPFAFAGLCGGRRSTRSLLASATILTTRANEVCAPVHDRMPSCWPAPTRRPPGSGAPTTPSCSRRWPRRARRRARPIRGQPRGGGGPGADRAAAASARGAADAAVARNAPNSSRPISIHAGRRSAASATWSPGAKPIAIASGSLR